MKKALCTLMAVAVLLGQVGFALPAAKAEASKSEVIVFSDPVLEASVRKQMGKPEGDITVGDAEGIDQLDCHNETKDGLPEDQLIHDISSLAYFKNLFLLTLFNNSITDISALSGMAGLKYLDIGGNNISDLRPLAGLPLESLDAWNNQISDVTPLGGIVTLKHLQLFGNKIADFSPLANLNNLEFLMVKGNATLDFMPLEGIAAKLAEKDFEIRTTPFDRSEVIAFNDPALESRVRAALNKPEGDITAGDAAGLDWLDANAAQDAPESERIKDISALRYFVNLTGLKLDNNLITDISALSGLTNLKELWVLDNQLSSLEPLRPLTGLLKLGFNSGFLKVDFLGGMTGLEELRMDACRELPQELTQLKQLRVFCSLGGELTDISLLAQIPTLTAVDVSWNRITDLTPLTNLPLTELYLQGNPISDFTPIKELYPKLVGRNFDYVELKQPENPGEVLAFPDPVMEQKVRTIMNIPQGDITAGDAAKITILDLHNEWAPQIPREIQVTDLTGIGYFINLRELNASFNAIGVISQLAALTELKKVDLGGNAVIDISPLQSLKNLENVTLFGNNIRDLSPLSGLTALTSLHLGSIAVYDVSLLAALTNLDNLYMSGCGIEDITPLKGMTKMRNLELGDNYITDLSALANMKDLVKLMLANNPIADYSPIQSIYPNLQEKDFEYGQIFDVQVPIKPDQPKEPVVIPDTGLEAILREAAGVFDRPITQQDVCRITKIAGSTDGMWKSVSDITALKYCLNLEGIYIQGSGVSDLTPLNGLTRLSRLTVNDSAVKDVTPLGGMGQLVYLELKGNQIADVTALKALTQLERLDVSYNQIADLSPLYGLDRLTVLFISGNKATDTSGFAGIFKNLKEKDFDLGSPMESAQQTNQPKDPGKVIKFADKVLEKRIREAMGKPEGAITAGEAAKVETLNLGNEYQEKFPKGSQISNLSGIEYFVNLKSLDISWNKIKDIKKIAGLTKLETLRAFGNQISSVTPLAGLVSLNNLNIGGNKVTKIDALKNLVNLTALYLSGNPIKSYSPIETIYPQLKEKDFSLE